MARFNKRANKLISKTTAWLKSKSLIAHHSWATLSQLMLLAVKLFLASVEKTLRKSQRYKKVAGGWRAAFAETWKGRTASSRTWNRARKEKAGYVKRSSRACLTMIQLRTAASLPLAKITTTTTSRRKARWKSLWKNRLIWEPKFV